jgi:hypothetical protein
MFHHAMEHHSPALQADPLRESPGGFFLPGLPLPAAVRAPFPRSRAWPAPFLTGRFLAVQRDAHPARLNVDFLAVSY